MLLVKIAETAAWLVCIQAGVTLAHDFVVWVGSRDVAAWKLDVCTEGNVLLTNLAALASSNFIYINVEGSLPTGHPTPIPTAYHTVSATATAREHTVR